MGMTTHKHDLYPGRTASCDVCGARTRLTKNGALHAHTQFHYRGTPLCLGGGTRKWHRIEDGKRLTSADYQLPPVPEDVPPKS